MRLEDALRADPAVREAERGGYFQSRQSEQKALQAEPPCSIREQPAGTKGARQATEAFIGH